MLDPSLLSLLREPGTRRTLVPGPKPGMVTAAGTSRAYRVEGHAVDLLESETLPDADSTHVSPSPATDAGVVTHCAESSQHTAPELRDYHERIFSGDDRREALYDNLLDLPELTQAAHFRRMEILNGLAMPNLDGATAVDFGSGPWGFATVFPRLRSASVQVTIDISFEALRQAQAKETGAGKSAARRLFLTSDGDTIGLADDCVTVVWAGEVIEHVRYPALFLQEIARILKPEGLLVLSTPNRDAPLYAARGLQNTVGPEHIALLSTSELRDLVSEFFDVKCTFGYEFSLCHEVDRSLRDPTLLRALQERAMQFPDLSSGVVLSATVRKDLLEAHRRQLRRSEVPWHQFAVMEGSIRAAPLFGDISGGFLEEGSRIAFSTSANTLILLFWSHDWSGVALVEVDGVERRIDLFSHAGGFRRVEWKLDGGMIHHVVVGRVGAKRPEAVDTQVIFYKSISYFGEASATAAGVP